MRVLHVTPYFAPAWVYGGPPRSIHGLCRALRDASVDARVVTTTANGSGELPAAPDEAEYCGVPVRYCARRFPRILWNGKGVRSAVRAELAGAALVHVHGLWHIPGWVAASEARRLGVPYVISTRGMLQPTARAHHAGRKRFVAGIQTYFLRRAALIHATSPQEAHTLRAFRGGPSVRVVPNGVDLPPARPCTIDVRQAAGIGAIDPIVLFLGRIHPIKRLDLLAGAVAAVRSENPRVTLVIAGADELGTLAALSPILQPLGSAVRIVGHVDDEKKWAWLREAAVLACCSDSENFALSVGEAMAAGVPVVVTRTCPWPDVERASTGFWVEQRVDAVAQGLRAILGDPAAARAMGERGRLLIERSYSWPVIGRAMASVYDEVVREHAMAAA